MVRIPPRARRGGLEEELGGIWKARGRGFCCKAGFWQFGRALETWRLRARRWSGLFWKVPDRSEVEWLWKVPEPRPGRAWPGVREGRGAPAKLQKRMIWTPCRVYHAAHSCLQDWSSVASRRASVSRAALPASPRRQLVWPFPTVSFLQCSQVTYLRPQMRHLNWVAVKGS